MTLPQAKLDDIWRAGFCRETVLHANTTDDTLQGSAARVVYIEEHVKTCSDCFHANLLKGVEAEVAEAMGPQAVGAFARGEDITERPGYTSDLMRQAMERLITRRQLTPAFLLWMMRMMSRKPFQDTLEES